MEIIELSGTYFEIGEQLGKAFGRDIKSSMDAEIMGLSRFFNVLNGFTKGADIPFEEVFTLRSFLELTFFMHKLRPCARHSR